MSWMINGQTFAEAKVLGATRNLRAGGGDVCHVEFSLEMDASTLPYNHLDTMEIHHPNGTLWFRGCAYRPARMASSKTERGFLEIRSMWYHLERITLTVPVKAIGEVTPPETEGDPSTFEIVDKIKSRVLLNYLRSEDGLFTYEQTTGDAFKRIVDHANSLCGSAITLGTYLTGFPFPRTEALDQKCSEPILGNLRRWHPDSIFYFDYPSGGGLCWKERSTLGTLALTPDQAGRCRLVRSEACPDLVPSGVAIHWERTTEVDGEQFTDLYDEVAGDIDADTIHFTFDVEGGRFASMQQKIKTEKLPAVMGSGPGATVNHHENKVWVKRKFPLLHDVAEDQFRILKLEQVVNDTDEDLPESFPRELTEGFIQPWMPSSVKSGRTVVNLWVRYEGTVKKIADQFAPTGWRLFSCEVMGTNAVSKVYKKTESIDLGSLVVPGLAEGYYNALQGLQNAGTIELHDVECNPQIIPGLTLDLEFAGFSTATIQAVSQDTRGGNTSITFGPHEPGLAPADFLEYQRAFARTTKFSFAHPLEEVDAQVATKKTLDGGKRAASNNQMHLQMENHEWFAARSGGVKKAIIGAGLIYQPTWNDDPENPMPAQSLKPTAVTESAALDVVVGDKIYCKILLSKLSYEPEGGFSASVVHSLKWSGIISGGTLDAHFSGAVSNPEVSAVFNGSLLTAHVGDDDDPAFNLDWTGSVDCGGGAVPSVGSGSAPPTGGSGGSCDCACTVSGAITGTLIFTPRGTITAALRYPGVTGAITGSVNGLTVVGSITPSTISVPTKVKLKVSHWDVQSATIVKESTPPESDDETAYFLIAEIMADPNDEDGDGIEIRQRHIGTIQMPSLVAVDISDGSGGGA